MEEETIYIFNDAFFFSQSGCNPNIQTIETEVLKTQASARQIEFEQKSKEARHRIIMLEKSKAMKRVKELNEAQENENSAKKKASQEKNSKIANAVPSINPFDDEGEVAGAGNPFMDDEDDGKVSDIAGQNPFDDENDTGDDNSMNPFLEDDSGLFNLYYYT